MKSHEHIKLFPPQVIVGLLIISLINKINEKMKNKTVIIENRNGEEPSTEEMGKLIEILDIPGTPFRAVKQNEQWFIAWGEYVLHKNKNTYKECLEAIENHMWDIIAVYVLAVMQETTKRQKQETQRIIAEAEAERAYKRSKKEEE